MIKMDNGALLALGLVGVVAAAGRMKRGSFGVDLRAQIQHVLAASEQDEEVDSGDLVTLLEQVRDSDQFSWFSRDMARDLLRQSEEDESLDTGDALSVLGDALRRPPESRAEAQKKHAARKGGSRAVGVHANSASGRVRAAIPSAYISRVAFERGVGGGTCVYSGNLKQHEWDAVISALRHEGFAVHGAMVYGMPAVCATKPKADPRKGGSRAVGVNANSAKSRAEYVKHLDDLTARAKAGKLTFDEDSRWSFGADTTPYDPPNVNRKLITQAILKNIAAERAWISTWTQRNPGAGSKAVYGMSPTDAGHVLRVGGAQPKIRSNAGEALNDYRWHPDRALAELEATRGKGKGARNVEEQGDEYNPDMDAAISDARGGGVDLAAEGRHIGTYKDEASARKALQVWCDKHSYYPNLYVISDHGNVHGPISIRTGKAYKRRGGSRARKIHDDREYTHYVVHGPTMKILSGWSYPEDAWEEIKDNLGTAGKDCKVYTRRHLTRSGLDPRENTNWGGAALHQSLFRT